MSALSAGSAFVTVKPLFHKATWASAGKVAATGFGIAAVAGVAAIKLAADFEDSMSKIVGLVGISRKQVDAWSKDILNLSKELPQSPKELADAMFFITSAGLRGKTALDALKVSARAAAAGLGDTKTVADAVTSAINAYGKGNLTAGRATDILTAAVREGKLEASSLAPVIGKVLPIAKATGVGFEEVAGAMALMSKSGTDAAQSATQVTAILGTFAKPSAGMISALKAMHLNLDDVRKSLADKGMVPTLAMLRAEAGKAGVDLSKVFGNKRALTGVLQLTGNLKETNSVMRGVAHSTGATDKAFDEASKTANFKFKSALSNLQVSGIKLGNEMLPAVTSGVEKLVAGLEWFDAKPKLFKEVTAGAVGFVLVLGPMISVVRNVTTAVTAMNVVLAANPLGALIVAGALAGAGLVLLSKRLYHSADAASYAFPKLKQYQETLEGIYAATTKATRAMVLERLEKSGLLKQTQALNISDRDAVQAALGNEAARKRVSAALADAVKHGKNYEALQVSRRLGIETNAIYASRVAQLKKNLALAATKEEAQKIQNKLDKLGRTNANPSVRIDGATKAIDQLTSISVLLHDITHSKSKGSIGAPASSFTGLLDPTKRAGGGRVLKNQPYIVGDRGPRSAWELFVPDQNGQILPHVSTPAYRDPAAGELTRRAAAASSVAAPSLSGVRVFMKIDGRQVEGVFEDIADSRVDAAAAMDGQLERAFT